MSEVILSFIAVSQSLSYLFFSQKPLHSMQTGHSQNTSAHLQRHLSLSYNMHTDTLAPPRQVLIKDVLAAFRPPAGRR